MIDGILNVNKPAGFTSHDVVAKLRGVLHQKKIGHTGTLDPDATGVLPVCLGQATKLCQFLTEESKSYEAVILLGVETDTQDGSGQILARKTVSCREEELTEAVMSFLGPQMQTPPMYSALKKDGKKLYELARAGIEVEREARPVVFHELEVSKIDLPRAVIRVTCSKGTYIRTLCHDIGQKLGCGACMESLVRTRTGRFALQDAVSLDEIQEAAGSGTLDRLVIPVEEMFRHLPAVSVMPDSDRLLHNGNPVPADQVSFGSLSGRVVSGNEHSGTDLSRARMYDSSGSFIGIFRQAGSFWRPVQMFMSR